MKAKHPHIHDLVIEIDAKRAAEYEAAGWLIVRSRKKKAVEETAETTSPATVED